MLSDSSHERSQKSHTCQGMKQITRTMRIPENADPAPVPPGHARVGGELGGNIRGKTTRPAPAGVGVPADRASLRRGQEADELARPQRIRSRAALALPAPRRLAGPIVSTPPKADTASGRNAPEGVTAIVADALELQGDALRRFLDRACGEDRALRDEVDSLLAEYEADGPEAFLAVSAPEQISRQRAANPPRPDSDRVPERIGRYTIVRPLGEGGMGTVYLAEQHEPVERRVALKVIRGLHRESLRARFAAECRALARLSHPNIASMYEVGALDGGLPYVAMEWIDGQRITDWCDLAEAGIPQRLRLFLGVCAGIKHAHEKGILHCDLKPSNVLVTRMSGDEVVKVIDFGIARALDTPLLAEGDRTRELILGSPPYLSPEAMTLAGRQTLDTRNDVYSLGLILYELLVGVLPYETKNQPIWSLLERLRTSKPLPPSQRLAELGSARARDIATLRRSRPARLARRLAGDLDAIVVKAIQRDPDDRYASPAELAADLERHLQGRMVTAQDPTLPYRIKVFVKRNVGAVVAGSLLFLALAGGLVSRTLEAQRTRQALDESEQVRQFMIDLFEGADPDQKIGEALTVRELLDQGAARLRDELGEQPLVRARFLHTIGTIYTKLGELEPASEVIAEALQVRAAHHPPGHPDRLDSEGELGVIYRRLGRHDEAEPILLSVLAARREDPEAAPELLARAHTNLGNLYWSQRRYDEAASQHRVALAIRERLAIREGTPEARYNEAASCNNLGVMLMAQRDDAGAHRLLHRAVEIFRQQHHSMLGGALNNLGMVSRNLPAWADAAELFRESLAITESALGPDHPTTLRGHTNLVTELIRKRRVDEAVDVAERAVSHAASIDEVGLYVTLLGVLGRAHHQAGDLDAAAAALGRAAGLAEERFGPDHAETLSARSYLANVWSDRGDSDRALEALGTIARIQDRTLRADHALRLRTERFLAGAYLDAGRPAVAERHYRRYTEASRRKHGDAHRNVSRGEDGLAQALAAQGRDDEAAAHYARSLAIARSIFGDRFPAVAVTAHAFALVEERRGNRARAVELLELAVATRRAVYPPDDPDLRSSIDALTRLRG